MQVSGSYRAMRFRSVFGYSIHHQRTGHLHTGGSIGALLGVRLLGTLKN